MKGLIRKYVLGGWYPFFWLIIASYLLYFKTLAFRLTYFDDNLLIQDNYWFLKDPANIVRAFRESVFMSSDDTFYRPLLTLSLMLDAHLGGFSLAIFHLTNICLHALSAALIFALFEELSSGRKLSFFAAMVFAVHPALSQAVAWIPGRNDSLLAVFILAAFICFLRFVRTGGKGYAAAHAFFLMCALLAKETAVVAVPVFAVFLVLIARDKAAGKIWKGIAPAWLAPLLVYGVLRGTARIASEGIALSTFRDACFVLVQYLGKSLLPFNLSVYPIARDTTLVYGLAAIAIIALAARLMPPRRPRVFVFGFIWFLLFLAPPFVLLNGCRLEHRLYLPVIGLFIALAELDAARVTRSTRVAGAAAVAVIALFVGINFAHTDKFMDGLTFWKSAVSSSPHSSIAHNQLALRYGERGESREAVRELIKAVEIASGNVNAHINLGIAFTDIGAYDEAEKALAFAEQLKPGNELILYNYGLLRYRQGRTDEARAAWETAFAKNPNFLYACRALAALYCVSGDAERYGHYAGLLKSRFKQSLEPVTDPSLRDPENFYRFNRHKEAWKLELSPS